MESIKKKIRDIPDFPKPGIVFKDITPVLADGVLFGELIDGLAQQFADTPIDVIAAIESRGFILGAALAYRMKKGLAVVRKLGKLPWETVKESYELEYGTDTLEMHADAIEKGQHVLVVDDLLATGGTASATVKLVEQLGGNVVGCAFAVELTFLEGRKRLETPVFSIVSF